MSIPTSTPSAPTFGPNGLGYYEAYTYYSDIYTIDYREKVKVSYAIWPSCNLSWFEYDEVIETSRTAAIGDNGKHLFWFESMLTDFVSRGEAVKQ